MKKLLLNKAMFLLAVIVFTVLYPSCSKNKSGDREDWYLGTTYSIADYYFKPKKLNITYKYGGIYGDWLANEKIAIDQAYVDDLDNQQIYADHYFFLEDPKIKKYIDLRDAIDREIFIDPNDIASPYKEYSEYFGDTILKTKHDSGGIVLNSLGYICVLPITGIDVTCDKDFDGEHPAGSKLNDIMVWDYFRNYYEYLNVKDKNGKLCNKGKRLYDFYQEDNYCIESIPLAEIPNHPLMMAEHDFTIKFNHEPTEHGKYEFTVKFHFGPDPLSGETVDIDPAKVSIEF